MKEEELKTAKDDSYIKADNNLKTVKSCKIETNKIKLLEKLQIITISLRNSSNEVKKKLKLPVQVGIFDYLRK